jgi:arsenate reductase
MTVDFSIYFYHAHPRKLASADTRRQAVDCSLTNDWTTDRVASRQSSTWNRAKPMSMTIYHNPGCSKSRKTLELLENEGISPTIIEYLDNPPEVDTLLRIATLLEVSLADLLRRGEDDFSNAGDTVPLGDEAALAAWLHDNPRVLERPIVVNESEDLAVVGRPPENVLSILTSG